MYFIYLQVQQLKDDLDVYFVVVGITDEVDTNQLKQISTNPDDYTDVEHFQDLMNVINKIMETVRKIFLVQLNYKLRGKHKTVAIIMTCQMLQKQRNTQSEKEIFFSLISSKRTDYFSDCVKSKQYIYHKFR